MLVDVDFTARHDLHTGIQRVVRQTVPLWNMDHDITPVAWTARAGALPAAGPGRVGPDLRLVRRPAPRRPAGPPLPPGHRPDHLVVIPWGSVLVLPEVPAADVAPRIAAIGACSNNRLVAIGHDAIPLVSAETVPIEEPTQVHALPVGPEVRRPHRRGQRLGGRGVPQPTAMLSSQGLPAPVSGACRCRASSADARPPIRVRASAADPDASWWWGSHDARKNHMAVLHAAEVLWQRGVRFRLSFIGSGGSNQEFLRRVAVLQHRGRAVGVHAACPTPSCGRPSRTPGSPCSRRCTRGTACRSPNRWPWAPR